ncbi:MAG: hypothetical protein IPO22_07705 [Anaerolineales bacterium]|nr:hypothetical protein [Anaerolineales bacterium]
MSNKLLFPISLYIFRAFHAGHLCAADGQRIRIILTMNIVLSEITNALGAAFFVFLFIIRVKQFSDGDIAAILLALQSVLAAFLTVMQ